MHTSHELMEMLTFFFFHWQVLVEEIREEALTTTTSAMQIYSSNSLHPSP
jgi:hypothetical protein